MGTFVLLTTFVGLTLLAFFFAYVNVKFGVGIYTLLLDAEYLFPVVRAAQVGDAVLKAVLAIVWWEVIISPGWTGEWKVILIFSLAIFLYLSHRFIYRSALRTFRSIPLTPLRSKNLRDILIILLCALVTALDISARSGGVFVSFIYAIWRIFSLSGYPL